MSNMQKSSNDNHVETSSMAFTIQLDDPKPEGRKLKIHDKLSSFALKHRRNPSLPEFKAAKPARSFDSSELKHSLPNNQKFGVHLMSTPKAGYHSEGYFSSDQDEESIKLRSRSNNIPRTTISPVIEDKSFLEENSKSTKPVVLKEKRQSNLRRSSMNDIDVKDMLRPKLNSTFTMEANRNDENTIECNKSDTVSEAGTYTVEKDDDSPSGDNATATEEDMPNENESNGEVRQGLTPENHKWINDWVKKVAEESSMTQLSGSGSSSASASKIPSPVNTMPKIREPVVLRRSDRVNQTKVNGSAHRRSSSLSAKDFAENRKSDSSLETESYLLTTESVMVAMQSRMRQNLNLNLTGDLAKKGISKKERLHPPSTASDTDTNSDNDAKAFKKPLGAPFTSARLNRAFNLRRGRNDNETESPDVQKRSTTSPAAQLDKRQTVPKILMNTAAAVKKPLTTSPFARTDCGRFSMRSTVSLSKTTNAPVPVPKKDKDVKKTGVRSNSSLSSKEMEFQNWKRRKSFDPMKAAAEGRKKEAAKKAAVFQSLSNSLTSPSSSQVMTQSVNLGTTLQTRSGNAVLRSASFHTSPHLASSLIDHDHDDEYSPDEEPASPSSSCFSHNIALPPNSPNRVITQKTSVAARTVAGGSRGSVNSEVHSSPSRRARAEFIDNLLVSAIAELSIGLKIKSCDLLKKLEVHCEGEDRITRMKEELAGCESQRGSASSSPAHKSATRDFPQILKNLKTLENVLQVVDDVLFGESSLDD